MQIEALIEVLVLLVVANGTPAALGILLGDHPGWPLDAGRNFLDGRRLLGPSKTLRGVLGAVLACALLAPVFGLPAATGALFGAAAMAGDLGTSFIKRRLNFTPGCSRPLLDQLPESCLPVWLTRAATGIGLAEAAVAVLAFTVIDLALSRLYRPDQAGCS